MKNNLKMPARYSLMDPQEMSEVTGGATLSGTIMGLVTGVVSGCGIIITSVASAAISLMDWGVSLLDRFFRNLNK